MLGVFLEHNISIIAEKSKKGFRLRLGYSAKIFVTAPRS